MGKEVYFLNDSDKESAYSVVKKVIKKHFKNNVKLIDWDKNLKYILGEDQVLLVGSSPIDKNELSDREERTDLFFTIISNDNWKLRCCGVWMEETIDLYEVVAPEGSRFITDISIDSFLPWELCSNWIRKQYKQLKKRTLDEIEENRNNVKSFLFDKAVKKINQLN